MIEQSKRGPWGARVMRAFAVVSLMAVAAAPAAAQFCSNCIINSAAPQSAQFNVTSGTVRGILTVGTLNTSALTVSGTMTAALFSGSGASLTALSASNLASGTVPTARVAGAYTGITQVGTLAAGTWQGTVIAPAYGGTGANLSISGTAGGMPWFTGSGVQGVVTSPAGPRVLATAGSGAKPVWVSSPALTGENFSAIPLTALVDGTLQSGIQVTNDSLVSIDAAKVQGNIAGGADFLTTPLPISDLAPGTLPTTNAASSVTVTGTPIGTFGGPTTLAQFRVGGDGRLYDAKQFNLVVYSTQVVPGPLPPGVTIAADQISSGTLGPLVIASSVAATAVTAGNYGAAARTLTLTVGVDGRLSAVAQPLIALPLSQLNNGTLPSGVKLPAASVNAGSLGATVIASSIAANGVAAGTYGSATVSPQLTVGLDGRITSITQFTIPGISTSAAWVDRFNDWSYPQTSRSSWTFTNASGIKVTAAVVAGSFQGSGVAIANLTPANMSPGILPVDVIASSVAARKVGDPQLTLTGVTAGTKGSASRSATIVVDAQGRITSLTDNVIAISTGEFVGIVQTAQGGTGNNWTATASGGIPYFSATGVMSVLAKSVNGYSLTQAAGIPAWAAAVSSATNLAGGAANSIPYQTAANTSSMLAAGSGVLQEVASGAPAWTLVPTLTGTNFSGVPLAALVTGGLPTGITITTGNFTGGFNGASQLVQLTAGGILPVLSGANLTALTAANISAGTAGIDISGNAATATRSTNLSGGLIGQHPYQTAANTTAFLPAMGAVGIIVGNGTGVIPSTATLTGTANQVVVTQSATAVTLSLPQSINSGAAPTFLGTNFTSIPAASINSGTLGSQVIASSVAVSGVTAATYGSASAIPVITIGVDGRVTSATTATPPTSKYIQVISTQTSAYMSGSTTIPWDDTIPQITEGWQVLTATITATSASSNLQFTVNLWGGEVSDTGDQGVVCVFKDTTANAIACIGKTLATNTAANDPISLKFTAAAGDTSSHVYSVRFGENVGSTEINGKGGVRKLGGAGVSSMLIEETAP